MDKIEYNEDVINSLSKKLNLLY